MPILFYYLYAASAVAIALGYMLFDVFNRREVPNLFVYPTLAFAFAVILLSGNQHLIIQSYLVAFAILGLGYFIYKIGQLGLGDVFELAALSLLLAPISIPLISSGAPGLALPSVISLFLDTGIAAIVVVPLFYVAVVVRKMGRSFTRTIRRQDVFKALVVVAAYLLFGALLYRISYARILLFVLIFFVVLGSALLLVFQRAITESMVDHVGVSGFTEDDIIAFNLMSAKQIRSAKRRVESFDRLVTKQMMAEMKKKKVKDTFPVYKRAIPFAVPIFFGALITIIAGNLLLLAIVG
jgi:Flp pilus assembly protein protease CpaA